MPKVLASICAVSFCVIALMLGPGEGASSALPEQDAGCGVLSRILDPVPHDTLSVSFGAHVSQYDGMTYSGCQIEFETHDTLHRDRPVPSLTAEEGSDLYQLGWRMDDSIGADGPGTSLWAIRKESSLCLILEAQPAYVNDLGDIVTSEVLNITIQCRLE